MTFPETRSSLWPVSYTHLGSNQVLRDIDFSVSPGDVTCIIGPSGSGKSTLLRCLNMLETPSTGEINYHCLLYTSSRSFKVRCLGDSQTVDFFPVLKCVAANHVWRDYNTEQNVLQVLFLYYFADILFLS